MGARLMRGGNNSFVIEVDLLNNGERDDDMADVIDAHQQEIIDWYREHLYIVDDRYMTDIVMTHLNGRRFRVEYQPGERKDSLGLKGEYSSFANPDDDGNHPITINGVEYVVFGDVVEGAEGGASAKTLKRVLKKAGLKTSGRKATLTRRAKKAHLV
jgi:hypothetical protein